MPGATLIDMLSKSHTKSKTEIELVPTNSELQVKIGKRASVKLPMLPADKQLWDIPEPTDDTVEFASVGAVEEFLKGISDCLLTIGDNTAKPDTLGVTIINSEKGTLTLYSTNDHTLTRVILKNKVKASFKRVLLSAAFCTQMLKLADPKAFHLEIHEGDALMTAGDVTLYGRNIISDDPIRFGEMVRDHYDEGRGDKMIPVPTSLRVALERAQIITSDPTEQLATSFSVKKDKDRTVLHLLSKSQVGEARDRMVIDAAQPEITVRVTPKLLRRGCTMKEMLLTERCIAMRSGNTLYLVGVLGK